MDVTVVLDDEALRAQRYLEMSDADMLAKLTLACNQMVADLVAKAIHNYTGTQTMADIDPDPLT